MLPGVLGVAALVVAGAGAVSINDRADAPSASAISSISSISSSPTYGTNAAEYTEGARERALSRDAERQPLVDATTPQTRLARMAEKQGARRTAALNRLGTAAQARARVIAKNQWRLPTTGYHLTARFGMSSGLWAHNHTGLDFAAPSGTPIRAVAAGVITRAGSAGAYGNETIETLSDGTEIWYCHQTSVMVTVGQHVAGSQQIGTVGSTGNTTGPHLHLEVRPGGTDPVDPYHSLVLHGVTP